jgi:hypothetical protein
MKQKETFEQKVKKAGSYKNYWTDQARLNLVGATIVKVEYMPQEEIDDMMWQRSPLCILLKRKNGTMFWVYPSADDEGNDGGALFTTIKEYPCAPVL